MSTKRRLFGLGLVLVIFFLTRNIHLLFVDKNHDHLVPNIAIPPSTWETPIEAATVEAPDVTSKKNRHGPVHTMIYQAAFGLGHRLIRGAAAWHLAQELGFDKFKFQWGKCEDETTGNATAIFPFLFGSEDWWLTPRGNTTKQTVDKSGKEVVVRNDVYGYLPSQTFQNHRISLSREKYKQDMQSPFEAKLQSDVAFYQLLQDRFVFRSHVEDFATNHRFSEHVVIGIHLRAGNGEKEHFEYAGRGIVDETTFLNQLVNLVHQFLIVGDSHRQPIPKQQKRHAKPPLVFLATDTASLVPLFTNLTSALNITTLVLPQIRLAENEGVTYSALRGAGEKCLRGWQAMVADMLLLSQSDVLIAARYSSFTQSMPLSLVFHQKENTDGPHFCEVSTNATTMSCFQDMYSWLYRDDPDRSWTRSLDIAELDEAGAEVHHKALIHLPDPDPPQEYQRLLRFLQEEGETAESMYIYGKKFNPKFRNRKDAGRPGWNFS